MKNKKVVIISSIILIILLIVLGVFCYIKIIKPHNIAVGNYKGVVKIIEEKNSELDKKIKMLQDLIDSNEKVLDENIIEKAKDVTKRAGASKLVLDEMPKTTEEIINKTKELSTPPDYTEIYKELDDTYNAYDTSIKEYKQFINPSEDFIIQRLKTIDEIADVRAVTEDNDPNGNLNKEGGYTSTVYFESKNINQNEVYGTDLIDKGTAAGGAIEVYANEDDANKRAEYLATFDGSIFASGTHKVIGTVLIRTSNELIATQQKVLEGKIIDALSKLQ